MMSEVSGSGLVVDGEDTSTGTGVEVDPCTSENGSVSEGESGILRTRREETLQRDSRSYTDDKIVCDTGLE